MRIGSVCAAHGCSLEVYFAQSLPPSAQALTAGEISLAATHRYAKSDGDETPLAWHALELV